MEVRSPTRKMTPCPILAPGNSRLVSSEMTSEFFGNLPEAAQARAP